MIDFSEKTIKNLFPQKSLGLSDAQKTPRKKVWNFLTRRKPPAKKFETF